MVVAMLAAAADERAGPAAAAAKAMAAAAATEAVAPELTGMKCTWFSWPSTRARGYPTERGEIHGERHAAFVRATPNHLLAGYEVNMLEAAKDEAKDRFERNPLTKFEWEPIPNVGDQVIARLDAFPPWPCEVLQSQSGTSLLVRFLADENCQALLPKSQVVAYDTQRQGMFKVRENNPIYGDFRAAVLEADTRCQKLYVNQG